MCCKVVEVIVIIMSDLARIGFGGELKQVCSSLKCKNRNGWNELDSTADIIKRFLSMNALFLRIHELPQSKSEDGKD